MNAVLTDPPYELAYEFPGRVDTSIRAQVWTLLSSMLPKNPRVERRHVQRYPFPRLILVTPADGHGRIVCDRPVVVVGNHISEQGLGFFHPRPLAHRMVVVSLDADGPGRVAFLMDLHRCRFTRFGWYESGGRFLRAVEPPIQSCQLSVVSRQLTED